jgi:hypothetical protein
MGSPFCFSRNLLKINRIRLNSRHESQQGRQR